MPVIVNADDFGLSESVNRAICDAFEKGLVNHTTLMANMPAAEEAAALAREKGFKTSVGLHLNLTEGFPLTAGIRDNPLICAPDGRFNAAFYYNTKYRLYMDTLMIEQIEAEFRAQMDRFLALGLERLHLDSHHHVHTDYPVFLALKRLLKSYSVSYLRPGRNLYRGGNVLKRIYKGLYNRGVRKLCHDQTSDLFGSYKDLMEYCHRDDTELQALLRGRRVEIMTHPVEKDGKLSDGGTAFSYALNGDGLKRYDGEAE